MASLFVKLTMAAFEALYAAAPYQQGYPDLSSLV